jgi:hypothetical protein
VSDPTAPGPSERQVSGFDPEGRYILSVLVKRTYRISASGRCERASEDLPLVIVPELDPARPGLFVHDSDLYPVKLRTDVIVQGHAYAPTKATSFEASLAIGAVTKQMLVVGDRRASLSPAGEIVFSSPEPVDAVALAHERAYGGADVVACAKHGNPLEGLAPYLPEVRALPRINPYAYARNPNGVGFLLEPTRAAIEALTLPNLEDPSDRLTPDRLAVRMLERWPAQPLPAAPGWISYGWFPRIAYLGFVPAREHLDRPLPEIALGALPAGILDVTPGQQQMDLGVCNGAPAGLQLPYLRGDEEIVLTHLSREAPTWRLKLPGDRPKIWTDGRKGKRGETEPVMHTLLIEPDETRLSIVWRGSCAALRPYFPEELAKMPFWIES